MRCDCRAPSTVVQSSRMAVSRLRRAGILLLVLWLTADVAALGFCSPELLPAAATSAVIRTADDSDGAPSCCTGHHCFCCSSGAEVITFEQSFGGPTEFMTPSPEPYAPDISGSNTSPPPRS